MKANFGTLRGLTFIEIVVAMGILAIAMLPLFSMLSRGASDTDITASQAFALNKATETLNTILDNVPFETLRQGSPAYLRSDDLAGIADYAKFNDTWCKKMAEMLFPGTTKESAGYRCRGLVQDPRGIKYQVWLRVEDAAAPPAPANAQPENLKIGTSFDGEDSNKLPTDFPGTSELTFSFLKNPGVLSDPNFVEKYHIYKRVNPQKPRWETECNGSTDGDVSEPPINVYLDQIPTGGSADPNAPTYGNPTATRFTQRMASEKVNYTNDDNFAFCTMKRLIVEVQWNLEKNLFSNPEVAGPQTQRIHLMTLKGDITR